MYRKQLFVVLLLLFIFILFASSAVFQEVFFRLTEVLKTYSEEHMVLGPFLFVLLAAASVLLGPFTSAPLVPSAIVIWGPQQTLVFLVAGWLLGNILSYEIGYYFGYPIVKKIVKKESLDKWVTTLSKGVDTVVTFLFRLATPSETGYIFGTLKYDFTKYLAITLAAEIPFAILTVYSGEAFVHAGWLTFLALGLLWIGIMSLAIYLLNKRLKKI